MGFATVQTIVAFIAKSEAMLGDSAAMAVDALTYGFNLYAEREKNRDRMDDENNANETDNVELKSSNRNQQDSTEHHDDTAVEEETERQRLEQQFLKRRRHLHLELTPPLMSVTILIVVTVFVLRNSIQTLVLDAHRKQSEQSIPNLELMMAFSTTNLLIDVFNVTCFARAKHLMGYNTTEKPDTQEYGEVIDDGLYLGVSDDDRNENGSLEADDHEYSEEAEEEEKVNLNMCSAYTHVFADTLRSIAVIIAAIIAYTSKIVTPEVADATAAVIVSAIILLSLVPLFSGLVRTWRELRSIASEVKFLSSEERSKEDTDVRKRQII